MRKIWLFFTLIFSICFFVCSVVDKLANKSPIIKSITANPPQISTHDTTTLRVEAEDPDDDILAFRWDCNSKGELVTNFGKEVQWIAPNQSGTYKIEVKVTDEDGGKATGDVYVIVRGDESPIVTITEPVENQVIPGIDQISIKAQVVFDWQIDRVDFFLGRDSLLYSDRDIPYEFSEWNVNGLSGQKLITVRAYDLEDLSNYGDDSVHVFIEGVVPVPE